MIDVFKNEHGKYFIRIPNKSGGNDILYEISESDFFCYKNHSFYGDVKFKKEILFGRNEIKVSNEKGELLLSALTKNNSFNGQVISFNNGWTGKYLYEYYKTNLSNWKANDNDIFHTSELHNLKFDILKLKRDSTIYYYFKTPENLLFNNIFINISYLKNTSCIDKEVNISVGMCLINKHNDDINFNHNIYSIENEYGLYTIKDLNCIMDKHYTLNDEHLMIYIKRNSNKFSNDTLEFDLEITDIEFKYVLKT
jgi:hypothetical protein